MGVNLVPKVDNFYIETMDFRKGKDDGSLVYGCISEGQHKVLRFSLHCHNIGDKDLVVGNPAKRPDIFEPAPPGAVFPWMFREKFNTYTLKNGSGLELSGWKRAFCLEDEDGRKYNCDNQGISSGNHDTYSAPLPCQFIVIDDLQDGEYTLQATTNAPSVDAVKNGKGKVLPGFEEDNYDDNTISVHLRINGNSVTLLS